MGPIEKLIKELERVGHPVSQPLKVSEIPLLISSLRKRLHLTELELDLSLKSFQVLSKHLEAAVLEIGSSDSFDDNTSLVELVRELAAYLGETLVQSAGGKWTENSRHLWDSGIVIDGPWQVKKEQEYISPYPTQYFIGGEAAWAIDQIQVGKDPGFKRLAREVKQRRIIETISESK